VISNAVDFIPAEARAAYARTVFDPLAALAEAGARAEDLDLRRYFGDEAALVAALDGFDAVWLTGGNVFLLMTAIRRSGFERAIRPRLAADRIVYGGWSAGAVAAGPDLRGFELMDTPDVAAEGYRPDRALEGLGLVGFRIVPHFGSDHPEAAAAGRVQAFLAAEGLAHRTLGDDEALVVRDGGVELRRF
jgi:dipeptidase E